MRLLEILIMTLAGVYQGVPVLDLLHISVRADGTPYEATRFVMRGDMTGLLYDVPVE